MTIQIKRTLSANSPSSLAFGELAWSDGNNTLRIGKSNGEQQILGDRFDFKQATPPDTTNFQGGEIWIETNPNGEILATWEYALNCGGVWAGEEVEIFPAGTTRLNLNSTQTNMDKLLLPHPCLIKKLGVFFYLINNNTGSNYWTFSFRLQEFSGTGLANAAFASVNTNDRAFGSYFEELPVGSACWRTEPARRILEFSLVRVGTPPNISCFNTPYCLYQKTRPL